MATHEQVEAALHELAARLADVDPGLRRRHLVDRTVSCRVADLGVVWSARLCADGLLDLSCVDADRAQLRTSVSGDDLLALVAGRLSPAAAWASGRLRVQASPLDLLRLRSLVL